MLNKTAIARTLATGALALSIALVGCGSNSAPAETKAAETQTTQTEQAAPAATETAPATTEAPAQTTTTAPAQTTTTAPAATQGSYIGDAEAKRIALENAGVAEADAYDLEVSLDTDDMTIHYDVDFKSAGVEYDYDIDATTGAIIAANSEFDD